MRAVALVYALAYFLAGPALVFLSEQGRQLFFSRLSFWLPSALSIGGALLVGWICSRPGVAIRAKLRAGLAFEILGSYGIAASEYHHITAPIMSQFGPSDFGMSWVAIWVMLFTVVVPTPPRLALFTAALSLSAVPVMYSFGDNMRVAPDYFFFVLIFPYLIVLMMAYAGSRVVYGLGTAVSKAREMGSYRLVERLGKGGMGEVWRARHRLLARPAAIKLIRPEVLGAKDQATRALLLRRFEREAQATASWARPTPWSTRWAASPIGSSPAPSYSREPRRWRRS